MGIKETMDVNFRGNIYIVQNGKVLYERENGFADLQNEISNTVETKFASASAGKVFVAVGILQLIERGRIKFMVQMLCQLMIRQGIAAFISESPPCSVVYTKR